MERVSPLNGVALREVVRIELLARGAEPLGFRRAALFRWLA